MNGGPKTLMGYTAINQPDENLTTLKRAVAPLHLGMMPGVTLCWSLWSKGGPKNHLHPPYLLLHLFLQATGRALDSCHEDSLQVGISVQGIYFLPEPGVCDQDGANTAVIYNSLPPNTENKNVMCLECHLI